MPATSALGRCCIEQGYQIRRSGEGRLYTLTHFAQRAYKSRHTATRHGVREAALQLVTRPRGSLAMSIRPMSVCGKKEV